MTQTAQDVAAAEDSPEPAGPAPERSRRDVGIEASLVMAGYFVVATIATWPLLIHPLGGFYGFGNDNLGGISIYGWVHKSTFGPGSPGLNTGLQYPFGWDTPNQALPPVDRVLSWIVGGPGDGLLVHNIQIFASFVLAGCTMYLLVRYLTGSRAAAAVAGFMFTFSPYHLAVSMQYGSLAAIQWLPLYLFALLVALRTPSWRNCALTGAALAIVWLSSLYYGFFTVVFTIPILVAYAVWRAVQHRRTRGGPTLREVGSFFAHAAARSAVGLVTFLVLFVPLALPSLRTLGGDSDVVTSHPISEAVRYSTRPWTLVLPTFDNPVFGRFTERTIMNHLYDMPVYEQSLYLGVVTVGLAFVAMFWRPRDDPANRMNRFLLAVGVVTGLAMMLGPYLPLERSYWHDWSTPEATDKLPWIGRLTFEIAPMFRFYSRNYVLVSVCLATLAGIGFARLLRRFAPTNTRKALFSAAVIGLIWCEFANAPPTEWFSDRPPTWVAAVRALPPDAPVIDYPMAPLNTPRSLYYQFWQAKHGHPTVNPSETDEALAFAATVANPDDPASGRALRDAGVEYAVVHTRLEPSTTPPYQPPLPEDSLPESTGSANPWFEPYGRTSDAMIYRVRTSPEPARGVIVTELSGFDRPEPEGDGFARWTVAGQVEYVIDVWGETVDLDVDLRMGSFRRPRDVVVSLDETVLMTEEIGTVPSTVPLDLGALSPGRYVLRIRSDPGPELIGGGDIRSVSLRIDDNVIVREMPAGVR